MEELSVSKSLKMPNAENEEAYTLLKEIPQKEFSNIIWGFRKFEQ